MSESTLDQLAERAADRLEAEANASGDAWLDEEAMKRILLAFAESATQALREQLEQAREFFGPLPGDPEYGGDDSQWTDLGWTRNQLQMARDHVSGLERQLTQVQQERDALKAAIAWALGEDGVFQDRTTGAGPYWWRRELRARSEGKVALQEQETP